MAKEVKGFNPNEQTTVRVDVTVVRMINEQYDRLDGIWKKSDEEYCERTGVPPIPDRKLSFSDKLCRINGVLQHYCDEREKTR